MVFKLPKKGIGPLGESRRSGTYACNSSVGRWYPLVRSSRWLVDRVYLNGDFTAYTIAKKPIAPGGGQPWRLRVMDTRTGSYLHEINFTYGAFITDFAVGRGGSLAYISYDFVGGDWFYWVKRRDGGGLKVLDKGRDIAEYSLDRSWTTISWINDGRRVSDTLY